MKPATINTTTAQPSAWGPSASHRNSGTPNSRSTDSAFGNVQTRSLGAGSVVLTGRSLGRVGPAAGH